MNYTYYVSILGLAEHRGLEDPPFHVIYTVDRGDFGRIVILHYINFVLFNYIKYIECNSGLAKAFYD